MVRVCGWQVKLCDPIVTHGPYLSALEVQHDKALYKFTLLYFTLLYDSEVTTTYIDWRLRRLGVDEPRRSEDDQQCVEHYPGGSSSAVHDHLYAVADLRLVQLPSQRQDVRAQHAQHSTHRQRGRHRLRQRLDLVASSLLQCRLSHTAGILQRFCVVFLNRT